MAALKNVRNASQKRCREIGTPRYTVKLAGASATGHTMLSTALLTPTELANLLGLALQTVYNRRATGGSLPPAILLGGRVRYRLSDVEHWLQNQYEHTHAVQEARAERQAAPEKRGRPSKAETIRRRGHVPAKVGW